MSTVDTLAIILNRHLPIFRTAIHLPLEPPRTLNIAPLQTLRVLVVVYNQCQTTVFFMDWEKSRGRLANVGADESDKMAPVSAWRLIMMMNEYTRLQVCSEEYGDV